MRTPFLSTTWHNFLGTALTTSKAFSHAATGTMGGSSPRIDDSVGQWSSNTRLSVQMDPAVTEHRWSCSTVAMSVTKAHPLSRSSTHFIHETLWHIHLITVIMLSNCDCVCACVCALAQGCLVTTTLYSGSFHLYIRVYMIASILILTTTVLRCIMQRCRPHCTYCIHMYTYT